MSKPIKQIGKVGIVPFLVILGVLAFWYLVEGNTTNSTMSNMQFIYEHFNSKGELIDIYDQVGVQTVDDIRLFVTDEDIKIKFGYIDLTWKLTDFVKQKNLDNLKKIYIEAYKDKKTGKIRVFYKEQEIERWVS